MTKMQEFKEACEPALRFIGKYYDTGSKIIISSESAEIMTNEIKIPENLTKENIKELILERLETLDIEKAKNDVQPFIKDIREIELWSKEFFVSVIENIKVR